MVRPRLTIRGLILLVVAFGLMALGYRLFGWAMWRRGVDIAIAETIENGPESNWGIYWSDGRPNVPRQDEYTLLRSDPRRSIETFLETLTSDPDPSRRINAARGLQPLFRQPMPPGIPPWFVNHSTDLVIRGTLPPGVEAELVNVIARCVRTTGLDDSLRASILGMVRPDRARWTPSWIGLLDEIGGLGEVEFLVKLGFEHDPSVLYAIHNVLKVSAWPGLFPSLERWLADPIIAPHAIEYSLLVMRPRGRAMLLEFARRVDQPAELRRRAVERLLGTPDGVDLVRPHRAELAWIEGLDGKFDAARQDHERKNGDGFWLELIEGLPAEVRATATPIDPAALARFQVAKAVAETNVRCLQFLSGDTSRRSRDDWDRWFRFSRPARVTTGELARLLLLHPDANAYAVIRRLTSPDFGADPDRDLPDLLRLAHQGRADTRFWACWAILLYTDSTEVVPDLFDVLGQPSAPSDIPDQRFAEISLLKSRFAENHFQDISAWRAWWAKAQSNTSR